jgi:hypothetical protein
MNSSSQASGPPPQVRPQIRSVSACSYLAFFILKWPVIQSSHCLAQTTNPAPISQIEPVSGAKNIKSKKSGKLLTQKRKAIPGGNQTPKEPPSPESKHEQKIFEPSLIYRISSLKPRLGSVYHKKDHVDQADQLYLTFKFIRNYDYRHEIVLEPSLRTYRNNPANWEAPIIEQAYIESALSKNLSFTVGKKLEYDGSGFMVNPSDLLNENKDVFDSLYQREGVVFSRLRYQNSFGSFSLGYIPKRSQPSTKGKGWLAASTEIAEIDLKSQITVQESDKTTVGISAARFFGDHFELHSDSRYQRRQRSVAELDWMEFSPYIGSNIKDQKDDSPSLFYLVGSRYVIPPRRTLIFEYITNESGLLPPDFKKRNTVLRQETLESERVREPPTRLLGRHYIFFSYQDDDTLGKTHLALTTLYNLDDKSTYGTLSAKYTLSPITSVEFAPNFFPGLKDSEFGEMPFVHAYYLIFRGRF